MTLYKKSILGDRAAIKRLNREQRDALVQTLVNVFNPNSPATPAPAPNPSPQPSISPSPAATPISRSLDLERSATNASGISTKRENSRLTAPEGDGFCLPFSL